MNVTKEKVVPLLPLRGISVFPATIAHLDVGRTKSIKAIQEANDLDHLIFVVTQIDADTENPKLEELYQFGTLAKLTQKITLPNGTVRITVEGLHRGKIKSIIDQNEFLSAKVEEYPDAPDDSKELRALMRTLLQHFKQYSKLSKRILPETIATIVKQDQPGKLADAMIDAIPLKEEEKQKILATVDVTERIHSILNFLQDEKELLKLEEKIGQQVKKSIDKTQKEYFLREQLKVIQRELGDREGKTEEVDKFLTKIEEAQMPETTKEVVLKELARYEKLPPNAAEAGVVRTYLDWMVSLPWSLGTEDTLDIHRSEKILNNEHEGLEKVKERILEYLAVQQLTNSLRGPILCLAGPPGVGKTSLARSIANALSRKFVRVSLGGVRDESEIRGHRRTYIGAMPGRIIQGIKKAGSNNPVFLLDEIDKMSSDFRGDPSSAMLEVLDPEQNNSFSDHYIEEPFDLSQVLFVATANDLSTIPGPLRDRMEIITLSGYTELEKVNIAKKHLFPKKLAEHGLNKSTVQIRESALSAIIRHYTREAGVRSLERVLATLCRKAAKLIVSNEKQKIIFTDKNIEEFLGKKTFSYGQMENEDQIGVATGLAYTAFGGDTLSIEVSLYPGKGKLTLTGKLGDVMKESAQAAFSYIRSKAEGLGIDPNFYEKFDIHIHVPEGAVPKDGPSAGITMATALISALTNKPIRKEVGMTGEITLRGRVLPIGGLKEKMLSAHRAGLTTVIIPKENEKDLEDVPPLVKEGLTVIPVSHLDEVLVHAIVGVKK